MSKNASRRLKERKGIIYSVFSGKPVHGHDVILASEAIDYVKKMGYSVYDFVSPIFCAFKNIRLPEPVRPGYYKELKEAVNG